MAKVKMRAIINKKYGKHAKAELKEIKRPKIKDNQVLIKIHAASVNPVDFKIAQGGKMRLFFNYKTPYIMGHDFAGEIVEVGKHISAFQVGDNVYGLKAGAFAEYITATQNQIAAMPNHLSYEEAASIPMAGLTSYQALNDVMHLTKDQKVLVQAGSGGVGSFAIQFAKVLGAYVATTTSSKNRELVKDLGADNIIDYRRQNFTDSLTNYDGVFDTLGGENLFSAFKILKPLGKVVSISGIPDAQTAKDLKLSLWKRFLLKFAARKVHRAARQHHASYHFIFTRDSRSQLNKIRQLIESGKIKPVLDLTFDFEETDKALEYIQQGHATGKVVIRISR
ncbi:NADPH:quinone reductase [Staphylococcus simulans]|nr:NADPH:quinone reductase [Staphylococcus simulans]PTJ06836.1 NADPH:quinone reductase [Staphylococcus simulans]PTJ09856.1 NADPH:quinone reductase [Staphylococcus simulans]PTJ41849.1 NADPH:quinone reductase [Staphylococcus simulans]PTJ96772.1 NADPH:quinone reductase [Staphylococcus simulans]